MENGYILTRYYWGIGSDRLKPKKYNDYFECHLPINPRDHILHGWMSSPH